MIPDELRTELAGLDLQVKLNDCEIYVKYGIYHQIWNIFYGQTLASMINSIRTTGEAA